MSALWAAYQTHPAAMPAFLDRGTPITWETLRTAADSTSEAVSAMDGPIYLYTRSAAAFMVGLIAAMHFGRPVICPGHAARDYLDEIDVGTGLFLSDAQEPIDAREPCAVALQARRFGQKPVSSRPAATPAGTDALSVTFMTSGTTAKPKAVTKTLRDLERESLLLESMWGGADGPVFGTVSHQHIYGLLFRVLWPVIAGRPSDAWQTEFWEMLEGRLGPESIVVSSPAHLSRFPNGTTTPLGVPRRVFSSGGPLLFTHAKECESRLGQLPIEVFGSTETGGIAWRCQDREHAAWNPLPEVKVRANEDGRLCVRSPLTGRREAVETGDLVAMEASGTFRFLGRADTVAKVEGKRVSLDRIEQSLRDLDWVQDASAVVIDNGPHMLGAVVALKDEAVRELERRGPFALSRYLRRQLASRLEPMERPKAWRFVDRIPVSSEGKRTQVGLRALFDPPTPHVITDQAATVRLEQPLKAEVDLQLDSAWVWFDGHFPGRPIFPGIAEVHVAVVWARRIWDWQPATAHLTRLKFSRVLCPGDRVRLALTRDLEKDTLRFQYRIADQVAGEGVVGGPS